MKNSLILGLALLVGGAAQAAPYFEGFENPYSPGGNGWNGATQVGSGTNGINSSAGNFHATATAGAFSRLGGYSSDFGGGFSVSQDIYLNSGWADGGFFSFSTAVSDQLIPGPGVDTHLRDFIWHVGVSNGNLLVYTSNNASNTFNFGNSDIYTLTGPILDWYTFETVFRDDNNVLAVDFNLYDSGDNLLSTWTRSNSADLIDTVVGGNRYAWFTHNTIGAIAIDNTNLEYAGAVVPIPAAAPLGLLGMGLIGLARKLRKKSA